MWRIAIGRNSHAVEGQAGFELALRKRSGFELPIAHLERLDAIVICPKVNDGASRPFPKRGIENAETDGLKGLHNLIVAGLHVPHILAVDDVKDSFLTASNHHAG